MRKTGSFVSVMSEAAKLKLMLGGSAAAVLHVHLAMQQLGPFHLHRRLTLCSVSLELDKILHDYKDCDGTHHLCQHLDSSYLAHNN